ncbi:MAG: hypothetical protein ACRC62_11475 [Microcoleus sp.]
MCSICAISQKVQQKKQPDVALLDTSQFSTFIDLKQLSVMREVRSVQPLNSPKNFPKSV